MIGAIGSKEIDDVIIFEVSSQKILNFEDFTRSNGVRFSENEVLLKKPVSQFVGEELDQISMTIKFDVERGVNPRAEMDKLIILQRAGSVITIVVGNKGLGRYKWRIEKLNMTWNRIDNKGNLLAAACDLSLKEYV